MLWPNEPDARPSPPYWSNEVATLPIDFVVMRREHFDDPNPIYALQAAGGFAFNLIHYGGINPALIAGPTKYFDKLTRYVGQVNNGGHGQYVENSQLATEDVEHCLAALAEIEAWDHLSRYEHMLRLCARPDQVTNLVDGAFNATADMKALDKDWFGLPDAEKVAGSVKSYLADRSRLHLVANDQYASTMLWLVDRIHALSGR